MEINCLIIDDIDQTDVIEGIIRKGKQQGLNIVCHQFNVGSSSRNDLLNEDNVIDINKVINAFNTQFWGIHFNLIAIDWNLSDDTISGIELIRQFHHHNIRRNTKKLLYSGILKDNLATLLHEYKTHKRDETQVIKWINSLITINIEDFVDRTEYADKIIKILETPDYPVDFYIEAELRKLKDFEFQSVFPEFKGKKFGEIADIIEKDPHKGYKFKKEIINQVISYLVEINS